MPRHFCLFAAVPLFLPALTSAAQAQLARRTIFLDGVWQLAEGKLNAPPTASDAFHHTVPVPGLVSLATPAFIEPGPKVKNRREYRQKDPRRDAFWYRRAFTVEGPLPAVARLKVFKALFGTKVFLNDQLLGEHRPCFTPGYFDAKPALKAGENELLIRVGADRDAVTTAIPSGFDYEKVRYLPGIFDSVQLILSGTPHFETVQVAPDIAAGAARVQAKVRNTAATQTATFAFTIREAKSGKVVGNFITEAREIPGGGETTIDVRVPIAGCRLWSPEDPFLYRLEAESGSDCVSTRFGMRTFKLDPVTGQAVLNGKPYFLRGSNITLYRFFEDSECGNLPWRSDWVRTLHQRIKDMHWNCLRYCIGYPPEAWYDVADELGILIQDEFPLWCGGASWSTWPPALNRHELAREYAEDLREKWNHPCVAIWDADNETTSPETGPAIQQVRGWDLSNRPWDNSYMPPQEPGDCLEVHPYHFNKPGYKLADLATANPDPRPAGKDHHAAIINEYGWLWLNRDGTPTTLTQALYTRLLGPNSTTAQRRHLYATYTAAETEFWRAHRKAAAVMHFTSLGYSRSDGQTSDHWLPGVEKLVWEPEFYRYVRDAFAPVGLMTGFFQPQAEAGSAVKIPITVINDLDKRWTGPVRLRLIRGGKTVQDVSKHASCEPLGTTKVDFQLTFPLTPGPCMIEARLQMPAGQSVSSVRDVKVITSSLQSSHKEP